MENVLSIQEFRNIIEKDYNEYYDFIHKIAFSLLKNNHDAEDLTSDVITKIWCNENITFKDKVNIKGWLRTVTINEYFSQNTKKKNLKHCIPIDTLKTYINDDTNKTSLMTFVLVSVDNQHNELVYKELESLIRTNLTDNELFYFNEQFINCSSYNDMVEKANVTLPVVKNKIHALRKKIISVLKENFYII